MLAARTSRTSTATSVVSRVMPFASGEAAPGTAAGHPRNNLADNITRAHHDSMERTMQAAGKCPTELAGLLGWLNRMLEAEIPEKLHKAGVEPDSVLGAPQRTEAFKRYIEEDPFESDKAGYYHRPLAAAISVLGLTRPLAAMWVREVARAGDWRPVAARRGWSVEETEIYLKGVLELLWNLYKPDIRRR